MEQNKEQKSSGKGATSFAQTYFHGTRADLKVGDLLKVGFNSNYFAIWSAKSYLSNSDPGRSYLGGLTCFRYGP